MGAENEESHGGSCIWFAKQILKQLGGLGSGRIYWVLFPIEGEEPVGHAYVIPCGARSDDSPLNGRKWVLQEEKLTVGGVLERGVDRTEEFLALPESMT